MVEDASRRADHCVDALAQVAQLHVDVLAAVDRQYVEALQSAGIGLECLRDLQGQLAGGRHDEDLGPLARQVEPAEERQCEGRRLAGSGLRLAEDVSPGEERWDGSGLDRRRSFVADFLDCVEDLGRETEFGEGLTHGEGRLLARGRRDLSASGGSADCVTSAVGSARQLRQCRSRRASRSWMIACRTETSSRSASTRRSAR